MDIAFSGIAVVLSFAVVYFLLPIVKAHVSKKELEVAKEIITNIVASLEAEEMEGQEKKKIAVALIKKILKLKKINIPDMLLNALIESSLYFLRKKFGKTKRHKTTEPEGDILMEYSGKEGR